MGVIELVPKMFQSVDGLGNTLAADVTNVMDPCVEDLRN